MALAVGLALAAAAAPAIAQGWWPFGGDDEPRRPPVPREPVYRPEPPLAPPPAAQPPAAANWTTKNPVCLQLEQRLVQEGQKGSQTRDLLPRIEAEIRQVDQTYNLGASKLDRNCYESFLFTRTFRSTPQCKDLAREVENAKRRLAELEAQRQDIVSTGGRSYQDDIIRELARNNCGANYADQARRRDSDIWQDEGGASANIWSPGGAAGAATYRTLCVRLCDGYYFPVSFSTLPSHFPQDAEICSSKCAAPAELYYYPNPGGSVDQSVALASQTPYTRISSRLSAIARSSSKAAPAKTASTTRLRKARKKRTLQAQAVSARHRQQRQSRRKPCRRRRAPRRPKAPPQVVLPKARQRRRSNRTGSPSSSSRQGRLTPFGLVAGPKPACVRSTATAPSVPVPTPGQ